MAGTEREADLKARLAVLEGRLAELEAKSEEAAARAADAESRAREAEARAMPGPLEAMETVMAAMLPAEVRGHLRAARKEQLLAMRAMVDIWIERVDRKPDEKRRHRRESISLDEA